MPSLDYRPLIDAIDETQLDFKSVADGAGVPFKCVIDLVQQGKGTPPPGPRVAIPS